MDAATLEHTINLARRVLAETKASSLVELAQEYNVYSLKRLAELELFVVEQFPDLDPRDNWKRAEIYLSAALFRQHIQASRTPKKPRVGAVDFQAVKDRIDIVEHIGQYVRLVKSGRAYKGLCPFHPDMKTASFYVWPHIKAFRCFGCGLKGDVITFTRLLGERGIA